MSTNHEIIENKFISWGLSPNGFIISLRSRNIFDEKELALGIQLLEAYLELDKLCISHKVLLIIVELYTQLCNALQISMRQNKVERTEAILIATHQIRELVYK